MMIMTFGVEAAWAATKDIAAKVQARAIRRSLFIFMSGFGIKKVLMEGYGKNTLALVEGWQSGTPC
tara:strand:- start:467 stop:664 length:198 start_codon:yes stop_codon:yes gene_type:complete